MSNDIVVPDDKCPECGLENEGDSRCESWQVYMTEAMYADYGPCKQCGWTPDRERYKRAQDSLAKLLEQIGKPEPESKQSISPKLLSQLREAANKPMDHIYPKDALGAPCSRCGSTMGISRPCHLPSSVRVDRNLFLQLLDIAEGKSKE